MNALQKDKPAPTSRNYAKMRNRLRGLLKKKREVEEYFEYHPDTTTTADQRQRESQPQVKFYFVTNVLYLSELMADRQSQVNRCQQSAVQEPKQCLT